MSTALLIFLAAGLAIGLIGAVIVVVAIRNAPDAIETEQGLRIVADAREARRDSTTDDEDSKLHGTNPQFS